MDSDWKSDWVNATLASRGICMLGDEKSFNNFVSELVLSILVNQYCFTC